MIPPGLPASLMLAEPQPGAAWRENVAYRFEHTGGQTDTKDPQTPFVTFVTFDDPYRLPQAPQNDIRFHRADATEARTATGG